jgi:hypothetical protein
MEMQGQEQILYGAADDAASRAFYGTANDLNAWPISQSVVK